MSYYQFCDPNCITCHLTKNNGEGRIYEGRHNGEYLYTKCVGKKGYIRCVYDSFDKKNILFYSEYKHFILDTIKE